MHSQLFHPASNEDGYVSVICHRERYLKELLEMGWFETADEALAKKTPSQPIDSKDKKTGTAPEEPLCNPVYKSDADALTLTSGDLPDFTIGQVVVPPANPGERSGADGLTKSQRKKLRLNK